MWKQFYRWFPQYRQSQVTARDFEPGERVELAKRFGVSVTTIQQWGRQGLLRRQRYDNNVRCLYEPVEHLVIQEDDSSIDLGVCERPTGNVIAACTQ